MTKTVELTDLKITEVIVNYEKECVYVEYKLLDADGQEWGGQSVKSAIFWVTMPSTPTDRDFLLPPEYISILVSLQTDADTALTARFLV